MHIVMGGPKTLVSSFLAEPIFVFFWAPALYMNSQGFKLLAHMVTAHLTHAHASPVTELEVI